jgi:hypothetical protein
MRLNPVVLVLFALMGLMMQATYTHAHGSPMMAAALIDQAYTFCPSIYPDLAPAMNKEYSEWDKKNLSLLTELRKHPDYSKTIQDTGVKYKGLSPELLIKEFPRKDCEEINATLKLLTGPTLELFCQNYVPIQSDNEPVRPVRPYDEKADQKKADLTIICTDDSLIINGQPFEKPFSKATLHAILGKPSRSFSKAYDIDTWDLIGFYAYARSKEANYSEIDFLFEEKPIEFAPKTPFSSVLLFRGIQIGKNTAVNDLEEIGFIRSADSSNVYKLISDSGRFLITTTDPFLHVKSAVRIRNLAIAWGELSYP